MIRFSVIMPLYNKAPYVRKALESIMAQTYRDFELIVVDDGSTDNSAAICEEFIHSITSSLINSLQLIKQPNAGVAAARNRGVKESKGEFLCFLDADDWWEPMFLAEMTQLIDAYPNAGIYATNYIYFKPGKTHVALNLPTGYINYPKAYYCSKSMPVWTGATCMPRKIFDEMGGFPVGIKLGEDFLLWAKTALHYPVAYCDKPLAYYNNDVPPSLRATRNLHAPEYHMLFHLEPLEKEINDLSLVHSLTPSCVNAWHLLFDWLRVTGLLDYWMSDSFHDAAAKELVKVDWTKQPNSVVLRYKMPIGLLRTKSRFMQFGSFIKQKLIHYISSSTK